MENRRRHYRHPFTSTNRLSVTLTSQESATTIVGVIVNLSIGGVCIESKELKMSAHERWLATFTLETATPPMRIQVERIYAQLEEHACCGFRFLPATSLNLREEQEKLIWKFLLEEQRGERRRLQEARRFAS